MIVGIGILKTRHESLYYYLIEGKMSHQILACYVISRYVFSVATSSKDSKTGSDASFDSVAINVVLFKENVTKSILHTADLNLSLLNAPHT